MSEGWPDRAIPRETRVLAVDSLRKCLEQLELPLEAGNSTRVSHMHIRSPGNSQGRHEQEAGGRSSAETEPRCRDVGQQSWYLDL